MMKGVDMTSQWNSDAEQPDDTDQDRQKAPARRYEHKSEEELINLLEELVRELKFRKNDATELITEIPEPEFSIEHSTTEASHFVKLPRSTSNLRPEATTVTWRIVLHSSNQKHKPLSLEVYEDIIIGRTQEYIVPDLDLTEYDALELGVSRQHALLHPTADSLELVDLLSANGTLVNQVRLEKGEYRALQNDDVLSFGKLHFRITIVGHPDSS
jgi:hypothetical protein